MAVTISVVDLVKTFYTPAGPLEILSHITIDVGDAENLAVVGPSGSGKSTFLHIIGTLDQPTTGDVKLLGENPLALDEPRLAAFRNQNIGFIFQEHHLLPQLSARENVLVPAIARGAADSESADRAAGLLDRVGLGDRLDHRPGQLSGGERQRVAVARALMNQPRIVLADEPTGSLDQATAAVIGELLLDLQQSDRLTLVCVTHNDELASRFDRQVRLESGRFLEIDSAPTGGP